ncbi:MAG: CHASE4 domain-containing protein [Desulfobacteraceae bacterium]
MSLKLKVAFIITGIFIILGFVDYSIRQFIIFPGFLSLEREEIENDAVRIEEAFNREIQSIDTLLHDWSAWDDTYEFIDDPNEEYIEANLPVSTFENNHLNLIYFISENGHIVWGKIHGLTSDAEKKLKDFLGETIDKDHPLRSFNFDNAPLPEISVSGIYSTPSGLFTVSSRPILTSNNTGPVRGTMIMGTLIDDALIKKISGQIRIDLNTFSQQNSAIISSLIQGLSGKKNAYLIDKNENGSVLNIYSAIPDITGKNALILKAERLRKIALVGYSTTLYATVFFLVIMISALVVMILLIHWMVVKPVLKFKDNVLLAREDNEMIADIISRNDEIGVLGREFKQLLDLVDDRSSKLERLNSQLIVDISKRIEAEEALLESEEQLRTVLENLPVGVFVHDNEGRYRLVNDVGCRITGYTREELLKMSVSDIDSAEFSDNEIELARKQIDEKDRFIFESMNIRKDGSTYPAEIHMTGIMLNGERLLLALVLDITDRKQAEESRRISEEQRSRSRKMESLGLMAGGVAHDLNNVLSGIVSYPEMILLDLPRNSNLRKPIEIMHQSGMRAVAIVQDLLTVARGVAVEKETLNINTVVSRYLGSAEHLRLMDVNPDIRIKTELDVRLFNIKGASVHIGKSLMNLVLNATEALDGSGEITVKTENKFLDRNIRGYEEVKTGEYVVLTVEDNGKGMPEKDLERIFEPFYSKKHMGRSGTGLGLAIVWNAVQEHDGYIDVSSGDRGTKFELYFPITRDMELKNNEIKSVKDYQGKGEKILVVDDVESQREIFCSMLEYLGYKPTSVSSGEEALSYLAENRVELIVLDMIMDPGIGGKETYERIIKIHPGQKAVIASGFAETEDVKETQRLGAGRFIKKPVSLEKLGIAVRDELDKIAVRNEPDKIIDTPGRS